MSNEGAGESGGAESGIDGQFCAAVSDVISPVMSDSDFLFKEPIAGFIWDTAEREKHPHNVMIKLNKKVTA